MSGSALPEISEREASGRVAELYEEIRRTVGLPLVNLVYRVLAATDRLDDAWSQLGPNLRDPSVPAAADELVGEVTTSCPPIPATALAAVGLAGSTLASARSTTAAYMHANPRNLLAVTALLEEAPGSDSAPPASAELPPAPAWDILPMAQLGELSPEARALLDEMSAPLVVPGEGALVPSLLRHFAHDPAVLAVLDGARPGDRLGRVANIPRTIAQARAHANALPYAVAAERRADTRDVDALPFTLSRMIVVGRLLVGTRPPD